MHRTSVIILFALMLILVGCKTGEIVRQPGEATTEVVISTLIAPPALTTTVEPSATPTYLPSLTPTQPSAPTATPTTPPRMGYAEICLEILPEIPLTATISGQIILSNWRAETTMLFDHSKKQLIPFPDPANKISAAFAVSPDREKIAFFRYTIVDDKFTAVRLMVMDAQWNVLAEQPGYPDLWENLTWLGNDQLVIGISNQPYVINPFTGSQYNLDWYSQSPGYAIVGRINWLTWGVYDTKLETIFYWQNDDSLLLWEIKAQKLIARIEPHVLPYSPPDEPKWSPDESQIVFSFLVETATDRNKSEFFSLNRAGELTQLTYLTDYFDEVFIEKFNWSPDGRFIAFIFRTGNKVEQLGIYDVITGTVTNYCNLPGKTGMESDPLWSPDSGSIIFEIENPDDMYINSTALLDIRQGIAYKLADNLEPAAWFLSAP